jgi:hypothetical protein
MSSSATAAGKQLLWGDTHLHTTYSSDAYANGNLTAGPDVAYRYARGMPVVHPYHRARVQIETPLDFLVVSDHAEFLGGIRSIHRNGVDTSNLGIIDTVKAYVAHYVLTDAIDSGEGRRLFVSMLPDPALTPREDAQAASMQNSDVSMLPLPPEIEIDAWKSITDYSFPIPAAKSRRVMIRLVPIAAPILKICGPGWRRHRPPPGPTSSPFHTTQTSPKDTCLI